MKSALGRLALATLLLGTALLGLSVHAVEGHPAHYLVFELDTEGLAVPLFHRLVVLDHPPESTSERDMLLAEAEVRDGATTIASRARDAGGGVKFRKVIHLDSQLRGEFHGASRSGKGWQIDSVRFERQKIPFVVIVPRLPGGLLELDGISRSVFDLDRLAGDAETLPLADVATWPMQVQSLAGSGDPANRVDVLIMGDGYSSSAAFDVDATALSDAFFSISPYSVYANYVNVTTFFTPSVEDGADHPPYDAGCVGDDPSCCADLLAQSDPLAGTYVDTAFDGRFCAFNTHRLAVIDSAAALAAASAGPDWDHILMVINDETYGGSGGFPPVSSTHPQGVDIARHEYGHSFTGLADEYDLAFPGFPACSDIDGPSCEPNVTDETAPGLIKWAPWIDPGTPIAFSTAAARAAPQPLVPPSPAPLTPRGLRGLGASSETRTSTGGASAAVGIR